MPFLNNLARMFHGRIAQMDWVKEYVEIQIELHECKRHAAPTIDVEANAAALIGVINAETIRLRDLSRSQTDVLLQIRETLKKPEYYSARHNPLIKEINAHLARIHFSNL